MKHWLLLMAIVLTATGSAAAAQKAEFVYAATDAGTIYQYRIAASGALLPLTPPSILKSDNAIVLVQHPSGRFAYAVTVHQFRKGHDHGQVFPYRISPNGTLAPLGPAPLTVATPADNVRMDSKGRFLFVSGEDGRLFTFRIRHDGTLLPLPDNMVEGTFHIDTSGDGGEEATGPYSQDVISLDPAGRFLYLFANTGFVDHSEYRFVPYRLDRQGTLHRLAVTAYAQGNNGNCFSTRRGGLFVERHSLYVAGTYQYHIGPRGLLAPASPPLLGDQIALLATEALDGETLWTYFPRGDRRYSVASYRVGPGGRLTVRAAHAAILPSIGQVCASRGGHFFYFADDIGDDGFQGPHSSLVTYASTARGTLRAVAVPPLALDGVCLSLCVGVPRGSGE